MKTCKRCTCEKPYEEFHKNKRSSDGHAAYCKPCKTLYNKRNTYERTTQDVVCCSCNLKKSADSFHSYVHSKNGLQSICKDCQHIKQRKYYETGGVEVFIKKIYRHLKRNANSRNIPVEVDSDYLIELYNKQQGKCALTGLNMTHESYASHDNRIKNIHNISPDRINSNIGYIKGNIQLVCSIINTMKWDLELKDFIHFCNLISERSTAS